MFLCLKILRQVQGEERDVDGAEETMKNGRKAIKGKCPTCGTVMFKILGGKATPPPHPRPRRRAG